MNDLTDRKRRLASITKNQEEVVTSNMLRVIALDAVELYKLSNAVSFHIWDTLSSANLNQSFNLSDGLLVEYEEAILRLPNRTPNGLLVPRQETFLSFNIIQKHLVQLLVKHGLVDSFAYLQAPCNLRIVSGLNASENNDRPYSSEKMHTDVWYGEPLNSILFNLPILGNSREIGINFYELPQFPLEYRVPLSSYDDGAKFSEKAQQVEAEFNIGSLFVSDALSLHKTSKTGNGIRVSLDWRALPNEVLDSEKNAVSKSRANYFSKEKFLASGKQTIFVMGCH